MSTVHKRSQRPDSAHPRVHRSSLILRSAATYLLPLLLLFSVFLLMRGHEAPGGGFAGGLVAAAAFSLHGIAHGLSAAEKSLPLGPRAWIGIGLLLSGCSGLLATALGEPFLTAHWIPLPLPVMHKLGTPLLFDLGVYLTVLGTALDIFFSLMED